MTPRETITKLIADALSKDAAFDISVPPHAEQGHYATNAAMRAAKDAKKKPLELAEEYAKKIAAAAPAGYFEHVEAAPPGFVNFWLSQKTLAHELAAVVAAGETFGAGDEGKGKTAIVEYSQPNIAKKMHVGHFRSTLLGDALANVHAALGYKVIRWNYLGDWGTQFGKLIAAYKMWGKKDLVEAAPIQTLLDLYVRFHDEMKYRPELEEMGRKEFQKLEAGDQENRELWEWFRRESLLEFAKTYELLGVAFDVDFGESYFEKDLKPLIEELQQKGVAKESQGSLIVPFDTALRDAARGERDLPPETRKLPPGLIRKSDGASLYLTRDIAALRYRVQEYQPAKLVYVVGNEQSLHFEQLFAIADILGLAKHTELIHAKFGLVLGEGGKKFSTREGRAVFAEEVIFKTMQLARDIVDEKNKELPSDEKEIIARTVGVGALKYANLKEWRLSDIVFDWEKMLDFAGDSAPYLQYTYARLRSICAKAGGEGAGANTEKLVTREAFALVRKMLEYPEAVRATARAYSANHLCTYLYEFAVLANKFYETTPILKDEDADRRNARLLLVATAAQVLKRGLGLLGIGTLEKI
jgi:arginyl-tRNA synthetase